MFEFASAREESIYGCAMKMVLFDLDGTLVVTRGISRLAFENSGKAILGPRFSMDNVDLAGRLDPKLFLEACQASHLIASASQYDAFQHRYHKELEQLLAQEATRPEPKHSALPQATEVLQRIADMPDVVLGLLTGNYEQAAFIKLRSVSLGHHSFEITAFGDEASTREQLVALAMKKFESRYHAPIEPERVLIVGDTPRDIRCAHENRCRCLAVATGRFSTRELSDAGADWAIENLEKANILWHWLSGTDLAADACPQ